MIWIIMYLSNLAHIISKITDQKDANDWKKVINWIMYPKNTLYIVLGLLTSTLLLFMVNFDSMPAVEYGGFMFKSSYVLSGVFGWAGSSIWRALINKFKKRMK